MVKVRVLKADITKVRAEAIVNPANSYGSMGGGVAWAIKRAGGLEIEDEAMAAGPTQVGEAVATTAGSLQARYVIHAPTMRAPAERIGIENVRKATQAALRCADSLNLRSVAFPGMGTGVGGVGKSDAAAAMVSAIKGFNGSFIEEVILVGFDEELAGAFLESVKDAGL